MPGSERAAPTTVPKAGDLIAEKYEVERVLGAGGMGTVVAARHKTLGQRVAIKFVLPELTARQPEAAERFLREARASINLRSEHVARVMDVGTLADGAPYMVMEYLEGKDLQQIVREDAPLPITPIVEYVLQAAEALAEAHAMGIVHRDLKPANLFLSARADGSPLVKVLDFGISKALTSDDRGITRTDAVLGSPGYMSPEQIRNAKNVDQRADVWGLGVILYELLTAMPPFDGDNIATLSAQIVLETPKPIQAYRRDVPDELAAITLRCLEKEPARRFQNMAELAEALEPYASNAGVLVAQRVRRIVRATNPQSAPQSSPSSSDLENAKTIDVWEQPKGGAAKRQKAILLAIAGGALLVLALVTTFIMGRQSVTPESEPIGKAQAGTVVSPGAPPPPVATTAPAPAAPPPAATAETANSAASPAASLSPAPAKQRSRSPAPQAARQSAGAKCPAGNVLSNGHCCPTGLVWQNGRCDRPLATSLP